MPQHLLVNRASNPELLARIFVGRTKILADVLQSARLAQDSAGKKHYFLLGERGVGKTALLRMIKHCIDTAEDFRGKWITLLRPDRAFGTTSVADVLHQITREILQALSDNAGVATSGNTTIGAAHRELFEGSKNIRTEGETDCFSASLSSLDIFFKTTGVRLWVGTENAHIFIKNQLGNKEKSKKRLKQLKELLSRDWLHMVSTATQLLPTTDLVRFFKLRRLQKLTESQQIELFAKLATENKNPKWLRQLHSFEFRFRALHRFTQGNPRMIIMTYNALNSVNLNEMGGEIEILIDQLTPYYQDRVDGISDSAAKLVEAIALSPSPSSAAELAKALRMKAGVARVLLARLCQAGIIKKKGSGKATRYGVFENMFRIWLRINAQPNELVRYTFLLEFFASWYGRKDAYLPAEFQFGVSPTLRQSRHIDHKTLGRYMDYVVPRAPASPYKEELAPLIDMAVRGEFDSVKENLLRLDDRFGLDATYFMYKGVLLSKHLRLRFAALGAFETALKLDPREPFALYNYAVALEKLGQPEKARDRYGTVVAALAPAASEPAERRRHLLNLLTKEPRPYYSRLGGYLIGRSNVFLLRTKEAKDIEAEVLRTLTEVSDPRRRTYCVVALGLMKSRRALSQLVKCLDHPSEALQKAAARALGYVRDTSTEEPLLEALSSTKTRRSPSVRAEIFFSLGLLESQRATSHLTYALREAEPQVRANAAEALGRLRAETSIDDLERLLEDDTAFVRGQAVRALGLINSRECLLPIIEASRDVSSYVRGKCAAALGHMGYLPAVEPLSLLAASDEVREVRAKASFALCRLASGVPEDQLMEATESVLGLATNRVPEKLFHIAQVVLSSVLKTRDLGKSQAVLELVVNKSERLRLLCRPYEVATEWLRSGEDASVLEAQEPEMRAAVSLLLDHSGP